MPATRHCVVRLQQAFALQLACQAFLEEPLRDQQREPQHSPHESCCTGIMPRVITDTSVAQHCTAQVTHRYVWVTGCQRHCMLSRVCRGLPAERSSHSKCQWMSPPLSKDGLPDEDNLFKVPSVAAPARPAGSVRLQSLLQVLDAGSGMTQSWRGTGMRPHHAGHSWGAANQRWWLGWHPGPLQKQQTLF